MADSQRLVSTSELTKHTKPDDLWIVVNGKVFDMTRFAPEHPGGPDIIWEYAGLDATQEYSEVHQPDLIERELKASEKIGRLDQSTVTHTWLDAQRQTKSTPAPDEKPPLSTLINLHDFERACERSLSKKAWAFIWGASNDNLTRDGNKFWFQKLWFRPRILKNVVVVNTRTKMMGAEVSLPVWIAPAGLAKTAGPEGELALAKGAASTGIVQCIATTSSFSVEEILSVAPSDHPFFFQLYVDKERHKTEALLHKLSKYDQIKALFVTVDLPVVSKREADERIRTQEILSSYLNKSKSGVDKKGAGLARALGSFIDPSLSWSDLKWIRQHSKLPIILKGVQSAEDARKALQMGCQGIVVSNHGGRALDSAPPSILVLLELNRDCPEIFGQMEVFVDGGVRRGSDVLKALCLGAKGVGVGRPFMYAVNYDTPGVEHAVSILQDELETAMRLCGLTDLREANMSYLNTAELDQFLPSRTETIILATTIGEGISRSK